VRESRARSTFDTAENRFVKAFLDQAMGVVRRVRREIGEAEGLRDSKRVFRDTVRRDCALMSAIVSRWQRHAVWDEVGPMVRVPLDSAVLQRRRGYRRVLTSFIGLHTATKWPSSVADARRLLAAKDIALLYELWTYFAVAEVLTDIVGRPIRAREIRVSHLQVDVPRGTEVVWRNGVRLAYNRSFGPRGSGPRSYSVGLRPDISLSVPQGPSAGLHLLDAKFRLQSLAAWGATSDDEPAAEAEAERRGKFRRDDLYKMHTYRDAIDDVRSVWALYPGDEFIFFDCGGGGSFKDAGALPEHLAGVGAVPVVPTAAPHEELKRVVAALVAGAE